MNTYDVIIIGAGHAGIEAALASSRMGCRTALITLDAKTIGLMSCNPAIGGVGKGQLVKEIDALGGEMARAADACAIQFRRLNASKGAAVRSSRAQIDKDKYAAYMYAVVHAQKNLSVLETQVTGLIVDDRCVKGVRTDTQGELTTGCLVLCPGTFLNGLIHIGLRHFPGGRIDEPAAIPLEAALRELGITLLRFKTGTCARLDRKTIDFSRLTVQEPDALPYPFSFSTRAVTLPQIPCHITYTNERTHTIIRENLDKSPLYAGIIQATGVRYCPSIEDKIVKFADKSRHQIFLEPEGLDTDRIYPNGLSTSLPEEVQRQMIQSVEGLEDARIVKFGYGIEHSVIDATQLYPTLEAKAVRNLFFAGQINGTTGYEEAAGQGLVAGINAALRVQKREGLVLDRASSYIGVLIDDLTTKPTSEPYRMFTSRVEYRLLLREDNADVRLRPVGYHAGLVSEALYKQTEEKKEAVKKGLALVRSQYLAASAEVNEKLEALASAALRKKTSLEEILKRPQIDFGELVKLSPGVGLEALDSEVAQQVEIEAKYAGFIDRQLAEVQKFKNLEKIRIPEDISYRQIAALSREIKEKLEKFRPINLGQASRISGITPAAISLLMIYLKKRRSESV